ncbi:EAL domain-containing protein [Marinobacter salicampi]|uniref:EAL domain-containing protein n=1 Tax=Marinobacter salicampi TaxID=435907 RepID=UPI001409B864|nr:EAL domain-containing protein [Marinobacter salicampi]
MMKRKNRAAGLLVVCLLWAFTVSAQELTVQGNTGQYVLNSHLEYFLAADRSLEQALQRQQWQEKHDDSVLNLGFTGQPVWLRTSLNIPEPMTRQWYVVIPYPLLEEVDLYLLRDGQTPAIYHTSRQEVDDRREQAHSYQVALPLPRDLNGQVDVYLKAKSATSLQVPVELWREDHLLIQFSKQSLYWGAFFGVMCALVIYNLFLFLSIRDLAYGYYVLYIGSISLLVLCISGVGGAWIWTGQPLLPRYALPVSTAFASLFALLFARSFLKWQDISPRWDRSMKIAAGLTGVLIAYTWVDPINGAQLAGLLGTLVIFLLIAVGLASLRAGVVIARFFVLAWATFALGASLYLLSVFDFLPVNLVTTHAMQVGSVAEVLLLSFALAHRIKDERSRKLAALRKQQMAERQVRALEMQSLDKAMHDSITGMPNVFLLNQQLQAMLSRNRQIALTLVHYPQVKEIASSMGHRLAEEMFCELVAKINRTLARIDGVVCLENRQAAYLAIPEFGSVAFLMDLRQLEGDLQPSIEQAVGNHEIAVQAVRLPVFMNLHCGVAIAPEHGQSSEILYQHASAARDRSESSKIPVQVYNNGISDFARRRLDLVTALPPAILAGELELYLQPQMNTTGQELVGAEILLRWHSPRFGTVPTGEVIEIAENAGLMDLLSRYIVTQAWKTMRILQERQLPITCSINLSVQNLTSSHFVAFALAGLRESAIPTNRVIFEVTETAMMHNMEAVTGSLQQIASSGCKVALDDFGTGYSSLAYLSRLPIHELKIDGCFISQMCSSQNDLGIVQNTLTLARALNLETVAEGVEDNNTRELLSQLACHRLQGYLFARPMPLEKFCDWALAREY